MRMFTEYLDILDEGDSANLPEPQRCGLQFHESGYEATRLYVSIEPGAARVFPFLKDSV